MPAFAGEARVIASCAGVHDLRTVEYPGSIVTQPDAEIRENLEKVLLDRIIEALTKPVESSSTLSTTKNPEEIVFEGTLEEVNEFFYEKGWTDGPPIIPPTVEKVEEFLKYTDRSPDEEIVVLPPANLGATPRNIAVNAVMAGCRPECFPLLIAAVEAIGEPDFQLMNLGTTGATTPWLLVNGPIVKQLGIEYGVGLASRGPNTIIGRAFHLIVRNVAGFRPAETLMGTFGYMPAFVLAEDEEACDEIGWEPYHMEHGFNRDASTVTARATWNWGHVISGARDAKAEPIPILNEICAPQGLIAVPIAPGFGPRNMFTVLITPPIAKVLADGGYSKRDVAEYVWENIRVPRREVRMVSPARENQESVFRLPERFANAGPDEMIPVYAAASPEVIDVVVCGNPSGDKLMNLWCVYHRPVTKEIKLPAG
ncbi:hypothetical protein ACFLWC_06885 [Chloroflexota bacterium]